MYHWINSAWKYYGHYLCIIHKYSYLIKTLSTQKVPPKTTEKCGRWYVATEVTIFGLIFFLCFVMKRLVVTDMMIVILGG